MTGENVAHTYLPKYRIASKRIQRNARVALERAQVPAKCQRAETALKQTPSQLQGSRLDAGISFCMPTCSFCNEAGTMSTIRSLSPSPFPLASSRIVSKVTGANAC